MRQQEYFGFNSINNLRNILLKHKPKNIFLVTGKNSYEKCGAKKILNKILRNYNVVDFTEFEVNPKFDDIKKGLELFKKNNCDFVIAVGGGTTLDIAKAVNLFASNEEKSFIEYINNPTKIKNKGKVTVAIPTTSGSGSEATRYAVLYKDKVKYTLTHNFIIPEYAIVDPQFTMNLPAHITAFTGMDALSQAIESYWSINSTDESKKYSREAIKLIIKNIPLAVNNSSEISRGTMTKAAHLAGNAINITKTTACHAISYPITSYFNVPHGHAVALTIAPMIVYNSQVTKQDLLDKRGVDYVKNTIKEIVELIGASNAEEASEKITNLMKEIGLSTKLSELGIETDEDIEIIIRNGFNPDRVNNNPRKLTEETLRGILYEIR